MPWFKIDDEWHSHPKVRKAGNAASGLWARCGSYSSQYLLNGFVPEDIAKQYGTKAELAKVTEVGLWVVAEGGYLIPDFLDYNPSAEQVKRERAAAAERQRRAREAASLKRDGHGGSHGVTAGEVTDVVTVPPSRPVPSRPIGSSVNNSPSADTQPTRRSLVVDEFVRIEWSKANQGRIRSKADFDRANRERCEAMPDLARYVDEYPTACLEIAAWLLGEKGSMVHHQRHTNVIPLRGAS